MVPVYYVLAASAAKSGRVVKFLSSYVGLHYIYCVWMCKGVGKRSTRYACKDDASHFIKSYWLAPAKETRQGKRNLVTDKVAREVRKWS